ncbi:HAMP domain-containing sensor histidine kinase [Sphingosinicella sp. BN140058]|uniref:sensor histidine kinase n=1 Tax=Sphingosinicella sp. BN140058 TaxID=1892855 RepID=UPI0010115A8E|nr:HAMP domain-containing sensor histidine kinase [Sphingosinicella sp. BN140058]QAY76136.1 HAMP domain-containing histidine kinase [Sphingosinicella sp. BN140058]
MIGVARPLRAAKTWLKGHWPALRLRTILFATLLFVAALPGIGAVFLRVYENTLVQQTEAELIAQGAVLAGAYRASWPEPLPPPPETLAPQQPRIDLNAMSTLPSQADWRTTEQVADTPARIAGLRLLPIVREATRTTLAAIRVLDAHGIVVLGRSDLRKSYAHLPEVRAAVAGRTMTMLRENDAYEIRYPLQWLSRAATVRVHYVRPIEADGRVIGILMLSRSPRGLFVGIYQDRGKIALGIALIFATLLVLAALLSRGITRPIEALSEATENVARGSVSVPEPPPTAAIEIQALYVNFAAMAERIERRSRYLRDFAAAVSHELKTPIAGIKGVLELMVEHPNMRDDERARFLANANADADRLSHLLRRLLDLARADMALAPEDSAGAVADPAMRVADAHRSGDFAVTLALDDLPPVSAPEELLEAVLETLVENSRQVGANHVRIAGRADAVRVGLTVCDDGPGIPPADHQRIFEPFHTSRRAEGGSGLGLSIARSLLAACGGTIASVPAEYGARFEICLPVAASVSPPWKGGAGGGWRA